MTPLVPAFDLLTKYLCKIETILKSYEKSEVMVGYFLGTEFLVKVS